MAKSNTTKIEAIRFISIIAILIMLKWHLNDNFLVIDTPISL